MVAITSGMAVGKNKMKLFKFKKIRISTIIISLLLLTIVFYTGRFYLDVFGASFIQTSAYYFLQDVPIPEDKAVLAIPFWEGRKALINESKEIQVVRLVGPAGPHSPLSWTFLPQQVTIASSLAPNFPCHLKLKLPVETTGVDSYVKVSYPEGVYVFNTLSIVYKNGRERNYPIGKLVIEIFLSEDREMVKIDQVANGIRSGLAVIDGKLNFELGFFKLEEPLIIYGIHFPKVLEIGFGSQNPKMELIFSELDFLSTQVTLGASSSQISFTSETFTSFVEPIILKQGDSIMIRTPLYTSNRALISVPKRYDLVWITDQGLLSPHFSSLWREWSPQEIKK